MTLKDLIKRLLAPRIPSNPLRVAPQPAPAQCSDSEEVDGLASPLRAEAPQMPDPIAFTGDFQTWEEAERASTGYAAPEILAKTREAMIKSGTDSRPMSEIRSSSTKLSIPIPCWRVCSEQQNDSAG